MKNLILLHLFLCFAFAGFSQGLWTQKATCPTTGINSPVSFTIQSLGYMYTGTATGNFFAYDPAANTWTAKADFPGGARNFSAAFATDSFGYLGTGQKANILQSDFYRYNPTTNTWSAIASYPDSIFGSFSFSINNLGYLAGGVKDSAGARYITKNGYVYNETSNSWTSFAPLPYGINRGFSAVANSKGYCGFGNVDSVYEYDPLSNSWQSKATIAYNNSGSYAFVENNKIYLCDIHSYTNHAGVRIFDPQANSWSLTNIFPYPWGQCDPLTPTVAFSIGNTGYMGAYNNCIGTTFWQYDTAHYFTLNTVSPDTICQRDSFTVSFSSNLSFGGTNYFRVTAEINGTSGLTVLSDSVQGNTAGSYTFALPPNYTFPYNLNTTSISVISTSPANQTNYDPISFYVNKSPLEASIPAEYRSCGGSAVLLYRSNSSLETNLWSSYPTGVYDTTYSLSFTPTQPKTTIYAYNVYTPTGCSVLDSTIVYLYSRPGLNISDSIFNVCTATNTTLGGTVSPDCSYSWTGAVTSSSPNPVVSPSATSVYHLFVKDTLTGCSVSGNTTITVKTPPAQTICYVTVDSASTHNVVIWEKLDKYATDSFYIYREVTTNNYSQIAAVHRDSLSEYHDYAANPNVTAYRYKISAGDTCGNASAESPYHNTIHLQYLGGGNLIWNVYEIENASVTPVLSFDVYRDSLANGNWQVMVNVPGNQYTATDVNFSQHPNARYRIVANWSYSCTPTRAANNSVLSNIIQISPNGINSIESADAVSLYPNPAKDKLVINCGNAQVQEITILGTDGKLIYVTSQPLNNQLEISHISAGIYIAEIKVGNTLHRIKWVKM